MENNIEQFSYLFAIALIIIYSFSLFFIFLYSLSQLYLLRNYLNFKKTKKKLNPPTQIPWEQLPEVTIQLPVFNEVYVMEQLLTNISKLNYPKEKFEIQVLDDSDDESVPLTKALISKIKKKGINIIHLRRKIRTGFKAGALKEGLKSAKGTFIAIFDADFLPEKNWLLNTIPHFQDEKIGVVQTRWGHQNRNYSILTSVQAFTLDAHFTLEQVGRNSQNHFINFNGTAGIWRKECIIDSGNWQADTLTEDLDLSYRAQLGGWKFKYLEDIITPAELPVLISAARSQQYRWNKGGAETFQKMIKKVLHSKKTPLKTKLYASMHLLNSTMFLNVFIVAILSIPMLYIKSRWVDFGLYFNLSSLFVISTLILFICYWQIHKRIYSSGFLSFIKYLQSFVVFFTLAMGFSFHNSIAVIQGHFGKKTPFVRTPKFNEKSFEKKLLKNKYINRKISKNTLVESLLVIYFLFGMYSAFILGKEGDFGLFPFHLMLFCGFGYVSLRSFIEGK